MKIVSLFNNKGGVGKTTLAFHLANILSEMGKRILMIDLDPQCNLTICCMDEEHLHRIWDKEDSYIEDFESFSKSIPSEKQRALLNEPRTIHFLLKPTEDGQSSLSQTPPPINLGENLDLIPGRLTVHMYENKISERWSGSYLGDSLSIRTITNIRSIAEEYSAIYNYDFVIIDTSPSLGSLNKVVISTVDGFLIPALPDMFSMYGIRNIGNSLKQWNKEFNTIFGLISSEKRNRFPENFVRFLGYTIYNAKKYTGVTSWDLAKAHYNYAQQMPRIIEDFISPEVRGHLTQEQTSNPIGALSVMHSHNTLPNMSQKYKQPIWRIPSFAELDPNDRSTIMGNKGVYEATRDSYMGFANSFLERILTLN